MQKIISVFLFCWLHAGIALSQTNVVQLDVLDYPGSELANIWGYAAGGNEYALVGAQAGLSIVNVTDPNNISEIVMIPGPFNSWKEIKTYQHYAYVVSEGGWGVQIVDLSNLPGSNLVYKSYNGDGAISGQLTKAHALHIDEAKGFLYVYGSNLFNGKAIILDLNTDPYNPQYCGYYNPIGYVHDGYAYNDTMYSAHIYAGQVSVVKMNTDAVNNTINPTTLGTINTPNNFPHNTWRSGNTMLTTDEVSNSYLAAYNISNPANITLLDRIQSNPGSNSIVHNTHILNDYAITSWYVDGFTIVDITRPDNLIQTGNFDTYSGTPQGFEGCWGVYPFLPSGNILATNIAQPGVGGGRLFVCQPTYVRGCHVEGVVKDANTNQNINSATVELLSTTTNTTTNVSGVYKMGQLQSGTYTLRVSKTGYQTKNTQVTLSNGTLTFNTILLAPLTLPIELSRFEVKNIDNTAHLAWQTASEANSKGFEVEYSKDLGKWETLGFVESRYPDGGAYTFKSDLLPAGNHYFRLRQIDLDDEFSYTDVKLLQIGAGVKLQVTPNPNKGFVRLEGIDPESIQRVELYNYVLQKVAEFEWNGQSGFELPADLPSGVYRLRVSSAGEDIWRNVLLGK